MRPSKTAPVLWRASAFFTGLLGLSSIVLLCIVAHISTAFAFHNHTIARAAANDVEQGLDAYAMQLAPRVAAAPAGSSKQPLGFAATSLAPVLQSAFALDVKLAPRQQINTRNTALAHHRLTVLLI